MSKTRTVEMYVGEAALGESHGMWNTDYVDIPADTPEDKIAEVAERAMWKQLEEQKAGNVVFIGVYHIPDVEEEEDGQELPRV